MVKEEKPRSRVMPLSWDWRLLSNEAVEAVVERHLARLVLLQSTCPRSPRLKFSMSAGNASVYKLICASGEERQHRQCD